MNVYAVTDKGEVDVRSFAPLVGVYEDPVCGSGNAAVGANIRASGLQQNTGSTYTARQGAALGRDGYVRVRIDDDGILVGGRAVTAIDGEIRL